MTAHDTPDRLVALGRAIARPPVVAGVEQNSPMAGLERRTVGFVDVLAQSIGAVAPAAGTATVPALIAVQAGSGVLIAVAAAWLLAICVAATLNQFALRIAAPGSLYTFTTKGLGAGPGFAAASGLLVGYGFIAMFGVVGAAYFLQNFLSALTGAWAAGPWVTVALLVGVGAVCFGVLRRGIRLSSRVTLVIELASLVVILALLAIVLSRLDAAQLAAPFTARPPAFGGLVAGTAVALTAFVGFESAASLGREAARPFLTVPRTIRWTVLGVGAVYLLSAYTQLAGAGAFGIGFDGGQAVARLASDTDAAAVGTLLDLGLAASFTACAIASLTALARAVFTLGREGVLPRAVGRIEPLRKTPYRALAVVIPITVAVPLALHAVGWSPWQSLEFLIVVSAAGYITAYVLATVALPAFLRRIGESSLRTDLVAGIAAVGLTGVLITYLVVMVPGEPVAVAVVGGLAVLAALAYLYLRTARSRALARAGLFDHTTSSDLLGGS
ncbi:APC family permease [Gryllotalpicola protaetiae]|uniref:APC family permease n=1 Tax=Gryllotalpicola protaetiae TaxID=2419771 RepID=UPI001FE56D81|nr:APC family permease [Gryllotalpicola protaetiae]